MNTLQWVTKTVKERQVRRMAEVGVLFGQLSKGVIESCDMESYVMVERQISDELKKTFSEIADRPVVLMCMESIRAASLIADGSLDMVYIDADHTYENGRNDILLWTKKVREGGIISGHDYNPAGGYGVYLAVDELINNFQLQPDDASENNNIWWAVKNANTLRRPKMETLFITDFEKKKLVEYLKPGLKVLIRFGHGWGDTQMFYPIYQRLIELHPEVHFDLYVECGQEEIFTSYPNKEGNEHDLVFSLNFPMSEGSEQTKAEKCCTDEVGIEPLGSMFHLPIPPTAALPVYDNPFVLCHFQGTALPNSVNCPEGVAQQIWAEIIEAGKIPIECHFEHVFHNPVNAKYGFIDSNVRKATPKLSTLIAMVESSFAFIGVASGPFITALSVYPERTFFLERAHKLENYVKYPVARMDVNNYEKGRIKTWLEGLRSSEQM
jgi:hypothetical protein